MSTELPSTPSERLHLRAAGSGPCPADAVEVVYADAWDDLCDIATDLAAALAAVRQQTRKADEEFDGSEVDDLARQALRRYHDE